MPYHDLSNIFPSEGNVRKSNWEGLDEKDHSEAAESLMDKLDRILTEDTIIPPDLHIDDGDIPEMANFFEFCTDPQYGYKSNKPFSRQMWIYSKLFSEICPKCTKPKYFDSYSKIGVGWSLDKFASKVILFRNGVCPHCGSRRGKLFKKEKLNIYYELLMCAGQRSGKSVGVSLGVPYITHKYAKLQRPAEFFTGLSNVKLVGSVVSLSLSNVMTLMWEPILYAMDDSLWWNEYHKMLDYYGKKYGEELYKQKDTYYNLRCRKLMLMPEVPHKGKLRGKTRFFNALDELDWFDESEQKITVGGIEIHKSLDRSCGTVRQAAFEYLKAGYDNILPAFGMQVSSPSSPNGPLMKLMRQNEYSDHVLNIHAPTWEINPKMPRSAEMITAAYKADPVTADRDWGAIPPLNSNPFFGNPLAIAENCFGVSPNTVKNRISYREVIKNKKDKSYIYPELTSTLTNQFEHATILTMDAGYNNNSFGISIQHYDSVAKKMHVDAVMEIMPVKGETTINHAKILKGLLPELVKQFNVVAIAADRWQAIAILHTIEDEFPQIQLAEMYSLKYSDFIKFRSFLEDDPSVYFPKPELSINDCLLPKEDYQKVFRGKPVAHLLNQIATVVDKKQQKQVDKGTDRTDDILRAVVLGHYFLTNPKYANIFKVKTKKAGGFVGAGSGGNASAGTRNVVSVGSRVIGAS